MHGRYFLCHISCHFYRHFMVNNVVIEHFSYILCVTRIIKQSDLFKRTLWYSILLSL